MNKNNLLYCVHCEEMDEVLESLAGDFHYKSEFNEYGYGGVHPCYGPFTSTEPQPLPENWENEVSEPSDFDIAMSNLNAMRMMEGDNMEIDLAISNLIASQLLDDFNQ